jgi:hypothetical protein
MMTIDNLLLTVVNSTSLEKIVSAKDAKILRNLSIAINSHYFITENQGNLIAKILRENSKKLSNVSDDFGKIISSNLWSRDFRQVRQIRKFYIEKIDDMLALVIEFTFNAEIRRILQEHAKQCHSLTMAENGKKFIAPLTEKNIKSLSDVLLPFNFDVDDIISNHYQTINSWSKTEVENQFLLTNIEHKNFQKAITDDLGIETPIDQNIINDRSMRYRYLLEQPKNLGENLTENIANRAKTRVWIDKNQHSMEDVISSLSNLKRFPILVIFDTVVTSKYLENLKILSDALESNGIFDKIGVYFRLPNDEAGKQFNTFIADKSYNSNLDETTKVACVMSGKLPKFFLTGNWKPMSVIALDTRMGLRHGKTAVYSNCCDCIIEWAEEPAITDKRIGSSW